MPGAAVAGWQPRAARSIHPVGRAMPAGMLEAHPSPALAVVWLVLRDRVAEAERLHSAVDRTPGVPPKVMEVIRTRLVNQVGM